MSRWTTRRQTIQDGQGAVTWVYRDGVVVGGIRAGLGVTGHRWWTVGREQADGTAWSEAEAREAVRRAVLGR